MSEHNYLELLRDILAHGKPRYDRTGTGTLGIFGAQLRFDLREGFPLLTTKKVHWKSVAHELLWMLSGSTNVRYLQQHGVTIWDEWADEKGELGPVYGRQWRDFGDPGHDQILDVREAIIRSPYSRRHVVTAWDPWSVERSRLPPCHILFQFYVAEGELSCHMYQRSADMFLGVPFNIASYALLTHIMAHSTGLGVGDLIISFGDAHIYRNHIKQVKLQLTRQPNESPHLSIEGLPRKPWEYGFEDLILKRYNPHPAIKGEVSV